MADEVRELSYAQAIQEALAIAMERDERVFLMGEDIGVYGGAFQVTGDLVQRFGEERVMDTPISELGAAGVAVGAAGSGAVPSPIIEQNEHASVCAAGRGAVSRSASPAKASPVDTSLTPCGVQTSAQLLLPPAKAIASLRPVAMAEMAVPGQ